MKALCKTAPAKGAQFIDVEKPTIKSDELLVKIYRTSICGSDIPVYNYTGWAPQRIPIPFIFGHELCGTVEEVGKDAKGFQKGDFVNFVPIHDKDKLQVAGHPILDKTYEITFVLNGFGMPSDYVVFSIKEFPRRIERLESEDLY